MNPKIRRILSEVPRLDFSKAEVTQLSGGITNENYKITLGDKRFVLRISGKGGEMLGIDRANERRCAKIAAKAGIGAEIVASLENFGATLTRFIDGAPISRVAAGDPSTLRRIVRSIRKYHGGPKFPGTFSPFEAVRLCHSLAKRSGVRLPAEADKALQAMARLEGALGPCLAPKPCHNDLLAANLIDDGKNIRIIDWEYAAMGDPFFDLGNYAINQELRPEGKRALLKLYLGKTTPADFERLDRYCLASDLREAFWGFAQAGISHIDFDFLGYGNKHLRRFMSGVRL
jgi:thiamine kinase-like enzyme